MLGVDNCAHCTRENRPKPGITENGNNGGFRMSNSETGDAQVDRTLGL